MSSLTVTQAFFLGLMTAYTPSLIVLAVLLWRRRVREGELPPKWRIGARP